MRMSFLYFAARRGAKMQYMRRISIRELQIHTSRFVREAAEGSVILIGRRVKPVAELRPVSAPASLTAVKKARLFASMEKIWKAMPEVGDSTGIIHNDRNR
jgi:antitoxin (DNA-binding transcriptional repressor) of toxin-antitoxin stability system